MPKTIPPSTDTKTIIETDAERLMVEQFRGILRDLRSVAHNAPDGQVINLVEAATMIAMRKLTQQTLEAMLQEEIVVSEKKKRAVNAQSAKEKCVIVDTETKPW